MFHVFDRSGIFRTSSGPPVPGDWNAPGFRRPLLWTHGVQQGPENVQRRLRAHGDSAFIHLIEDSEHEIYRTEDARDRRRMSFLVRYSLDLSIQDTVAALDAIPLIPGRPHGIGNALPDFWEPLFSPRNLFATGDGWVALTHGDSASVRILTDGDPSLLSAVRWPRERVAVSDRDKDAVVGWTLLHALRDDREFAEAWRRASRSFRRSRLQEQRDEWLRYSAWVPEVTALFGAGDCLFLTGYRPEDFVDGTSASLVAVNLRSGRVSVRRLLGEGEALYDVGHERAVTTFRDPSAEYVVRVYEHGVEC